MSKRGSFLLLIIMAFVAAVLFILAVRHNTTPTQPTQFEYLDTIAPDTDLVFDAKTKIIYIKVDHNGNISYSPYYCMNYYNEPVIAVYEGE